MKMPLSFAVILTLLIGAGCGSKSDDPTPDPNAGIDPATAIVRTWTRTSFTIRTDQGDYKVAQMPNQFQTLAFAKDGKYSDVGFGLTGTYSFKENNAKLVLSQSPTSTSPAFTYNMALGFQGTTVMELGSLIVAVNPQKSGPNAEELDIAQGALGLLAGQTAINASTVKSVQIIQRFAAQ